MILMLNTGFRKYFPVLNEQGEIKIIIHSLTDEQLIQSDARFAEAQALAKVIYWETDLLGLKVMWSAETYRIFEVDPGFNTSHPDFLDFVHPEDKEKVAAASINSFNLNSVNSILFP